MFSFERIMKMIDYIWKYKKVQKAKEQIYGIT